MRLLDTGTKQLRSFYGKKIPRYAILSHMWGKEEDEVLFKHIAGSDADKREGEMRRGYAKVEGACRQAMEDGWKYIWIDTCCIDKTSSAELSEAINSMYEWYRRSEVCYAFLEDVRSDSEIYSDRDGERNSNEVWEFDSDEENSDENVELGMFPNVPFEYSRWFKRGWTLQELIAPRFVVFYSKDWIDVGTKASLRDVISAVTHIRVEVLMGYYPSMASVAEKMSWAAFRKTTRAEDIAYCLMGLLGVNMPLLYGEGDRAFRRLQEELMKVSDDDSLFAWKSRFDKFNMYDMPGMLAKSPWDFRDGMDIVESNDGAYSPYSMTNKGLQIKLPLLPIDPDLKHRIIEIDPENIFKAILKCTLRDRTPTQRIVIYFKKFKGHYRRIFPHWLDETETIPKKRKLTSLLVPEVKPHTTDHYRGINGFRIEILPTESGFTVDGHSLVEGYKYSTDNHPHGKMIFFKHQDKCFGVAVGQDWHPIPWLDFIDVVDEAQSYDDLYEEGGSRAHIREQCLDRLSEKISGGDWWLTVSVKRMASHDQDCILAVINIRKEPIRWLIRGSFSGKLLFKDRNMHSNFKKDSEGHDWITMYNPKLEKKLDVTLVYTLLPKSKVYCIQFSCDGKYLATGGSGNMVQVYDMETGAEMCTFINELTETDTCSICFSPDNSKFIATGDSKGCIKIWDIDTKCVYKVLNGHQNRVISLCFSPNGHLLISGSGDGTIRIWSIANGASRILTIPPCCNRSTHLVISIAISPNGSLLAAGTYEGHTIWIWDIATMQLLETFPVDGIGVLVAFTPDGKGLVGGAHTSAGTLKYWDVSGLVCTEVKSEFDDLNDPGASSTPARRGVGKMHQPTVTFQMGHRGFVTSVAVSHDGRWLISRLRNFRLVFWDLNANATQLVLDTKYLGVPLLGTSPAGNMFATTGGEQNGVVRVWHYDNIEPSNYPNSHVST